MKSLGALLTEQIIRDEITVEQAQRALIAYHHRLPALTLEQVEHAVIRKAMMRHNDDITSVCRELDISRSTLYRKLDIMRMRNEN